MKLQIPSDNFTSYGCACYDFRESITMTTIIR